MLCIPRSFMRLSALTFVLSIVPMAGRAEAQSLAAVDSTPAVSFTVADSLPASNESVRSVTPGRGAPMSGLRSAVHVKETPRGLQPNASATHANLGQSRAMIVVGAAALVTGAIIGGDVGTIIMVGGAVIGLYGLYEYLQ